MESGLESYKKIPGCYFFLFTGGEPLMRKKDILRLCKEHPDCQFTAFTNATLIDEAFADEMLRVKNFISAIIHYSDSNIREKTLLEGLQFPLFMACHKNQPFSDNLLRPCPLLDNQGSLANMVKESGARSTDLQNSEDVEELTAKCIPAADCWQPAADELRRCSGHCGGPGKKCEPYRISNVCK